MATTATPSMAAGGAGVLRIPERDRRHGPVTRSRLRRLGVVLGVPWLLGLLTLALDASHPLKALGLGLMMPAGGLWFAKEPLLAVIALALFVLAFVAWFATGNIIGPPLVWLGSALAAALIVGDGTWSWAQVVVPATIPAVAAAGTVVGEWQARAARRRATGLNRELERIDWQPSPRPSSMPVRELTEEDLQVQRHILDRALQPPEEFAGYDWLDQFQTSAVRYQLNFQQYALAMANLCSTPAFTGYLAEAQRRVIEKMLDRRVWRYWFLENLWGYLRWDPNPVPRRDNVMLTGYLGTMLGAYEQVTGDRRYAEPGALTFRWNEELAYPNDFRSIAANVAENLSASVFCLYPCEPNWIYSSCNTMAMNALKAHDSRYGTSYCEDLLDRFTRAMEQEFMTADGRLVGIRSARLGFSLPGITSTMADCISSFFVSSVAPDIARRTWEIVRSRFIHITTDGSVQFDTAGWDKIDTGNYQPRNDVGVHWAVILAARQMGDEQLASATQRTVEHKFAPVITDGVRRYSKASNQANTILALARFSRQDGWRDLIAHGAPPQWRRGPLLADTAYPDVLVAKAVSDGRDLELVLRPGTQPLRAHLHIQRLNPHQSYNVRGAIVPNITGDSNGEARIHVDLDDRHRITITPQP
jgi:Linalool dehydratase/isomerase